jgi:pimeloyl-ACP methyl ester carboxylesterase
MLYAMKNIVLFPGLAGDHRLFDRLVIPCLNRQVVVFLAPEKNETLPSYAKRLAETIQLGQPLVLIGVSFGGVLAQEVAKYCHAEKIILISSISSNRQLPQVYRVFNIFPVYEWLSAGVLKKLIAWVGRKFTVKNETETALFEAMLKEADISLIRWGIRQVLGWKQVSPSTDVIHIHGAADRLFPIKYIPVNYTIHKGEHFMIIQQRETISALLQSILA